MERAPRSPNTTGPSIPPETTIAPATPAPATAGTIVPDQAVRVDIFNAYPIGQEWLIGEFHVIVYMGSHISLLRGHVDHPRSSGVLRYG